MVVYIWEGEMRLVELFKALGENNRLRIVNILYEGPNCVCELQEVLGTSQVSTSKHLAKLRDLNIVKTTREAQRIFYSLTEEMEQNKEIKSLILSYRDGERLSLDLEKYQSIKEESHTYVCPTKG